MPRLGSRTHQDNGGGKHALDGTLHKEDTPPYLESVEK